MTMQISGNYGHPADNYAEQVREKQAAGMAEKAKEAEKEREAEKAQETGRGEEVKGADRLPEPRDEYISSEKSGKKPSGLYRVGQDENGNRKIFYEDPKAARLNGKREPKADEARSEKEEIPSGKEGIRPEKDADGKAPKAGGSGESEEICVGSTDRVDREIRNLKNKKQQLEQQLRTASGDEEKTRELEKKLAQVEQELSRKDNDTYRRQNTVFS